MLGSTPCGLVYQTRRLAAYDSAVGGDSRPGIHTVSTFVWLLGILAIAVGAAALRTDGAARVLIVVLVVLSGMFVYKAYYASGRWVRPLASLAAMILTLIVLVIVFIGDSTGGNASDQSSNRNVVAPITSTIATPTRTTTSISTSTSPVALPPRPMEAISLRRGDSAPLFAGDVQIGVSSVFLDSASLRFTSNNRTCSLILDPAELSLMPGRGRGVDSFYSVMLVRIDSGTAQIEVREVRPDDYTGTRNTCFY